MAKVGITETVLRDAHQSLVATRMKTEQMLPIIEKLDEVGYFSLECWGGATFDASLRFLDEDPWEIINKIKSDIKDTNSIFSILMLNNFFFILDSFKCLFSIKPPF
jgi:oxaloacetate decarboxylase alpha subunit